MKLSQLRARQIKMFLVREGMSTSKILVRGYGESRLINTEDQGGNNMAAEENRRVEFRVELNPSNEYCR